MAQHTDPTATTPRAVADNYVHALAELDPALAVRLGFDPDNDELPDLTPEGSPRSVTSRARPSPSSRLSSGAAPPCRMWNADAPCCCGSG